MQLISKMTTDIIKVKRTRNSDESTPPRKKLKKNKRDDNATSKQNTEANSKEIPLEKKKSFSKTKADKYGNKSNKFGKGTDDQKPPDWVKYKKEIKEVRIKRKQKNNLYETITKAKQIGEKLRCKTLKGGKEERKQLVEELHSLLGGNYVKFVLSHDMARVVQYLLKFGNESVRNEISKVCVC